MFSPAAAELNAGPTRARWRRAPGRIEVRLRAAPRRLRHSNVFARRRAATALGPPGPRMRAFDDGEWDAADLRARYVKGFTAWERAGYKPIRVPTRLRTVSGARAPVDVNGTQWLLALARVEPVGAP